MRVSDKVPVMEMKSRPLSLGHSKHFRNNGKCLSAWLQFVAREEIRQGGQRYLVAELKAITVRLCT